MKKIVGCILSFAFLAIFISSSFAKESTYKISPDDALEISVWKDESLSRQILVPPDGVISFPLRLDCFLNESIHAPPLLLARGK